MSGEHACSCARNECVCAELARERIRQSIRGGRKRGSRENSLGWHSCGAIASAAAMSAPEVFQRITAALHQAGIAYMLSGSFASAYYGAPRSTQDIDLVTKRIRRSLRAFVKVCRAMNITWTLTPHWKLKSGGLCLM